MVYNQALRIIESNPEYKRSVSASLRQGELDGHIEFSYYCSKNADVNCEHFVDFLVDYFRRRGVYLMVSLTVNCDYIVSIYEEEKQSQEAY
jgi:hypothetical protein